MEQQSLDDRTSVYNMGYYFKPTSETYGSEKKNPFFITAHCQCTWLPKNSDEDVKMGLMFPWLLTQNPFGSPWIKE
jgi:hypothetical protein